MVPGPGFPSIPSGCAGGIPVDLVSTNPFDASARTLVDALLVGDSSGFVPRAPCSVEGDADCDGLIDGVDLAILGMHFGADICDVVRFFEDADFNDDDVIDGSDLAALATFFGTMP